LSTSDTHAHWAQANERTIYSALIAWVEPQIRDGEAGELRFILHKGVGSALLSEGKRYRS